MLCTAAAKLRVAAKLSDGSCRHDSRARLMKLQVQLGGDLLRVLRRFYQLGVRFVGQFLHAVENGLILQRG